MNATDIQRLYGSNYYAASLLFPKHIRQRVITFYAFVRLADETVDNPKMNAAQEIDSFMNEWNKTVRGEACNNQIIKDFHEICVTCEVPLSYVDSFLSAMQQDLTTTRYKSYEDLQQYMYGSAEVIGLVLLKLFSAKDPDAETPARALGEAMQLTNFLRDIREDLEKRNRVYLPQADLKKFGIRETDLTQKPSSDAVKELMRYEVARAHSLYKEAWIGIQLLPAEVQPAVRAAHALYREILQEIEQNDFAVPQQKIKFSKLRKLKIALVYGYVKK